MTMELAEQADLLLVDDQAANLVVLEAILEPLGQRMVRAASGEEALRQVREREFAVILLDVRMPHMNGFETAQAIKACERARCIPIIFVSASSNEEEQVFKGYSLGAADYLVKPFEPEILRAKVRVFVDLYLERKRRVEQEQGLHAIEPEAGEQRRMAELLQSESQLREILGSTLDAILVFDSNGTVSLVNGAAERMFGTTAQETVGGAITRFFPEANAPDVVTRLCAAADRRRDLPAPGDPQLHSLTACRVNGQTFPMEASVTCADTPSGRTYTLVARDISQRVAHEEALKEQAASLASSAGELKQLNAELRRRQLDLERAVTARSRFYASMSHELRTPINAVLGYSTLLLERIYGPLNEKQTEGIERTQKAARHLLELVNDVLDLSKIEAGKIDLRLQPVAFPALIEDLFVTVRPLADEHGSVLSLDCTADRAMTIVSDPRRLRQILLNLISNAIKFGKGKPIKVVCTPTEDGGVTIDVIDRGEGISSEDQERIFHEFVQLGKTQLQDGTGLGLPISRRLAELLRGALTVDSTVGRGSTFRLRLPASADARPIRLVDQELPRTGVEDQRRAEEKQSPERERRLASGQNSVRP
jgi:PAS domain S-box-containing protein